MRSTRSQARDSDLDQKCRNDQEVLNSSWSEDEFVLRVSDEQDLPSELIVVPESDRESDAHHSTDRAINKNSKITNKRDSMSPRSRSARVALPVHLDKTDDSSKAKAKSITDVKVVLTALDELALRKWIKPKKKLNAVRKVNSNDDFLKRTRRYCLKCATITCNTSKDDDEPCRICSILLLYHCVKCGEKFISLSSIQHHLDTKCYHRKSLVRNNASKAAA